MHNNDKIIIRKRIDVKPLILEKEVKDLAVVFDSKLTVNRNNEKLISKIKSVSWKLGRVMWKKIGI